MHITDGIITSEIPKMHRMNGITINISMYTIPECMRCRIFIFIAFSTIKAVNMVRENIIGIIYSIDHPFHPEIASQIIAIKVILTAIFPGITFPFFIHELATVQQQIIPRITNIDQMPLLGITIFTAADRTRLRRLTLFRFQCLFDGLYKKNLLPEICGIPLHL